MTDTITRAEVEQTITILRATLERAQARLGTEATEFEEKKQKCVEVAHRRGNAHGIGVGLDDLLTEFDLPRRPERIQFRALVTLRSGVEAERTREVRTTGGFTVYPTTGTMVSWPVVIDHIGNLPEGLTCLCEAQVQAVRDWMLSYYGESRASGYEFQIREFSCRGGRHTGSRLPTSTGHFPPTGDGVFHKYREEEPVTAFAI